MRRIVEGTGGRERGQRVKGEGDQGREVAAGPPGGARMTELWVSERPRVAASAAGAEDGAFSGSLMLLGLIGQRTSAPARRDTEPSDLDITTTHVDRALRSPASPPPTHVDRALRSPASPPPTHVDRALRSPASPPPMLRRHQLQASHHGPLDAWLQWHIHARMPCTKAAPCATRTSCPWAAGRAGRPG